MQFYIRSTLKGTHICIILFHRCQPFISLLKLKLSIYYTIGNMEYVRKNHYPKPVSTPAMHWQKTY